MPGNLGKLFGSLAARGRELKQEFLQRTRRDTGRSPRAGVS